MFQRSFSDSLPRRAHQERVWMNELCDSYARHASPCHIAVGHYTASFPRNKQSVRLCNCLHNQYNLESFWPCNLFLSRSMVQFVRWRTAQRPAAGCGRQRYVGKGGRSQTEPWHVWNSASDVQRARIMRKRSSVCVCVCVKESVCVWNTDIYIYMLRERVYVCVKQGSREIHMCIYALRPIWCLHFAFWKGEKQHFWGWFGEKEDLREIRKREKSWQNRPDVQWPFVTIKLLKQWKFCLICRHQISQMLYIYMALDRFAAYVLAKNVKISPVL